MAPRTASWIQVFLLPELAQVILNYLDQKSHHSLRLANRTFFQLCGPFFSITLHLQNFSRYPVLKEFYDHTIALHTTHNSQANNSGSNNSLLKKNLLDHIKALNIPWGQVHFSIIAPAGMAAVLNRCRNLRSICLSDEGVGSAQIPERSFYPARLIWSTIRSQNRNRYPKLKLFQDPVEEDDAAGPWSFWDLLPLEGYVLCRLESLSIKVAYWTPSNLDRFFTRLGRSCVSKTLRSFAVEGNYGRTKIVSIEVLLDCLCDLKVLEELCLRELEIEMPGGNRRRQDQPQKYTRRHPDRVAPRVKRLLFKDSQNFQDIEATGWVLDLFPNLESLTLDVLRVDPVLKYLTDQCTFSAPLPLLLSPPSSSCATDQSTPTSISPGGPSTSSATAAAAGADNMVPPFSKLKRLDIIGSDIFPWHESGLLRAWARQCRQHSLCSPRAFRVGFMRIYIYPDPQSLYHKKVWRLLEDLAQEHITLERVEISGRGVDVATWVSTSPLFRSMESLDISCKNLVETRLLIFESMMMTKTRGLDCTCMDTGRETSAARGRSPLEAPLLVMNDFDGQDPAVVAPLTWKTMAPTCDDVLKVLPWIRTITTLSLGYLVDSRLERKVPKKVTVPEREVKNESETDAGRGQEGEESLAMLRDLLRWMTNLVDFKITGPIFDLALFEGLGRNPTSSTSSSASSSQAALELSSPAPPTESTGTSSSEWMRNYCLTERPLLRHLSLCQSHLVEYPDAPYPLSPWYRELESRFRFLEILDLRRERITYP